MGYAGVAFTDAGRPEVAGFPELMGIADERLFPESEMGKNCFEGIIGQSAAIRNVLEQVRIVAPTDATVLLHGETGTGKELVAHAIHNLSSRSRRSFVRMNCAAIPSGLLESELFGHEKGAFTGALMQKKGRFEIADQGTLFLDEIGDISLELQPKLLRAVQEQEFERLGSANTIRVNVRIIAATHRDLSAMIRDEKFREDLFYRLNVFPVEIPPLRERREDIPSAGELFRVEVLPAHGKTDKLHTHGNHGCSDEQCMAGKCSGIGELHRARGHPFARRRIASAHGRTHGLVPSRCF